MNRPIGSRREAFDVGRDIRRERLERLAAARVIEIERGKARSLQPAFDFVQGSRSPRDAVQQHDTVRASSADHATSCSGALAISLAIVVAAT